MQKLRLLLVLGVILLVFASISSADSLEVIGTASYLGNSYNLIYEDDQGLVWLDYTSSANTWQNQVNWASELNTLGVLSYNLNPGISLSWDGDWRLPSAGSNPLYGYNQTTSEMGHLYYTSLLKPAFGPLGDTSPFDNLQANEYWSGTTEDSLSAWYFNFYYGGLQGTVAKWYGDYALAVRPGEVSAVPIPGAIWLLGSGLIGLVGVKRNVRRRRG
ncbi:MAG: DUF1566 domain-containing protein [Proteobacteria bacterium]|nr:DUF1566 domain-containing protein [Pseudomonadota bacterium]